MIKPVNQEILLKVFDLEFQVLGWVVAILLPVIGIGLLFIVIKTLLAKDEENV